MGIAAGLLIGKQAGIIGASWLLIRFHLASLPAHATWRQFHAVCVIAGIGFTMSLFISALAFGANNTMLNHARLGVITGSVASAIIGVILLMMAFPPQKVKS
jgi:NhaA family Na+:H+ antiporter